MDERTIFQLAEKVIFFRSYESKKPESPNFDRGSRSEESSPKMLAIFVE